MESKNFEDLYEVLDADLGCSKKDIIKKYKEKISIYQNILKQEAQLTEEEKWEIKLLKIAKYVLTNESLRKTYNLSRIIEDTEDSVVMNDSPKQDSRLEYKEFKNFEIPLRKDQGINLKELSDRQFERYDHKNFDLTKDRQLRGATHE